MDVQVVLLAKKLIKTIDDLQAHNVQIYCNDEDMVTGEIRIIQENGEQLPINQREVL